MTSAAGCAHTVTAAFRAMLLKSALAGNEEAAAALLAEKPHGAPAILGEPAEDHVVHLAA